MQDKGYEYMWNIEMMNYIMKTNKCNSAFLLKGHFVSIDWTGSLEE